MLKEKIINHVKSNYEKFEFGNVKWIGQINYSECEAPEYTKYGKEVTHKVKFSVNESLLNKKFINGYELYINYENDIITELKLVSKINSVNYKKSFIDDTLKEFFNIFWLNEDSINIYKRDEFGTMLEDFNEKGYATIYKDFIRQSVIDRKGNILLPFDFKTITLLDKGMLVTKQEKDKEVTGILNYDFKTYSVEPKYTLCRFLCNKGSIIGFKNDENKLALFDIKGNQLTPFIYEDIENEKGNYILLQGEKYKEVYDKENNKIHRLNHVSRVVDSLSYLFYSDTGIVLFGGFLDKIDNLKRYIDITFEDNKNKYNEEELTECKKKLINTAYRIKHMANKNK